MVILVFIFVLFSLFQWLMTEIQFQPATLIDPKNRWNSIKYLTHDAFRTAKYLKGAEEYEDCQHAIEMHNVYGLSTFN